jgi:stearoyl-CoA desaturase (delta-9 desaturase)
LSAPALTRPTAPPRTADPNAGLPANALGKEKGALEQIVLYVFVVVPFLALAAVVPAVWGWGLSWLDVGLGVGFYFLTLLGVTVGYHRYFTHGSFKAVRPLRLALAAIGCMAVQGPVVQWVADHRRHHAFSDREGDPHSPWRYGADARALAKGMFHAHLGWLFDRRQTNAERYAPDLLKDDGLRVTSRLFSFWAFLSFALPTLIGGLVTHSWTGAWSAFFWAGLVRVALLHHVTWSINSVCHVMGNRPFVSPGRDRATNFWPLAILSAGESWHNLHHADPTCARHGVLRGQIDISARVEIGRELFAQKGYEATSIEEIAVRADVSKPVVYEHFGGKEGLYAVVVDREMQLLLDRFTSALATPGHPRELLERAALVLLEYIEDDTDGFRVLTRDAPVTSGSGTFSSLIGEVARKVEHLLGRQFDSRGYDPRLAELYSQALVGMVALVGQWWLDTRSPDKHQVAAHLVNLAYNGLAHLEPAPQPVDDPQSAGES